MTIDLDPKAAGFDPQRLARIDDHLRSRYVDPAKIAGCQVLVSRHGHVAHRSSLGVMDAERATPMADDAIWRWYSMTKPVTSVALLTLVERGLVKLTDPVHRFLPEWRDVQVRERDADGNKVLVAPRRPMQVRDALMHMTGIGMGPKEARLDLLALVEGKGNPRGIDPRATLTDLSRLLATEPLVAHPGERWLYGWSTDICACLVEAISGQRFSEYLQATIFDPLDMTSAGFSVPESEGHRITALYARNLKQLKLLDDPQKGRLHRVPAMESGGGGLVGTLDDYARFCQMLLGGGELDGARILGRPTVELMRTNHLPGGGELRAFAQPGGYGEVGFEGNGFGLAVAVGLGPAATGGVGPAGDFMWGGAASTAFWIDPTEDLFAVFMTALIPSGSFDFRGQLRSLVYAAIAD